MAENVFITPGSGDTVGADDIGSVKYQRIKIIKGVDGTNSGDISDGNPLPVSGNVTVSQTATFDVNLKSYVPVNFTASQTTASNLKMEAHLFDSSTNGISSTGGSLDINLKSYAPLNMTVSQSTAINLKTQAENYQGGVAVSTSNPLFVTLAPTAVVTDSITNKTPLYIKVSYSASQTGATVLTPTSGKKAVITDIVVSASGAGSIYLFDNTDSASTAIGPTLTLAANGGWDHTFSKMPYATSAINNVVKYTSGSGSAGSIWIEYYEV